MFQNNEYDAKLWKRSRLSNVSNPHTEPYRTTGDLYSILDVHLNLEVLEYSEITR